MQTKEPAVKENFDKVAQDWASEVINTLLTVKQNSLDIPKGYALTGVAIKEGIRKGDVEILFSFRKEDK